MGHYQEVEGFITLMLLSPLGERLGEGVLQETVLMTPSPNLSPKGERNMMYDARPESLSPSK